MQIARLRERLGEARREVEELREREERTAGERELLARAKQYSYYLTNVDKKIDVRELEPFGTLAARVRSERRTYLGVDRLYTLWQAVRTLPTSARAVAEVGVYRGGSARFIAEALRIHGRDDLPVYVCDTFEGHTEVDEQIDGAHRRALQFRRVTARKVAKYLRGLNAIRFVAGDIRDTARTFAGEQAFGLVHLDVDVYPITRFCLDFFAARLVTGGTIVVDDYGTTTCRGVQKAVDEFAASNPQFRLLHLLTGQAVLVRLC